MNNISADEKEFRGISLRLGFVLILNTLLLYTLLSIPSEIEFALTGGYSRLTDTQYALLQILYGALYMASFMLPVLLFRLITPKKHREPMRLAPSGGTDTLLLIAAGIGVVFSVSTLNAYLTSFVDFSALYAEEPDTPVALVMSFAVSCIVPAVCEEFLFRGCVLSNLLPYGKTTAVIASALMFALMHGNIKQFLYAFCAGIVLGLAYTESGSIVPPMLLHLCNNFFDLAEGKVYGMYGDAGGAVYLLFEVCAMLASLGCAAVLIGRRQGNIFRDGKAQPTRTAALPTGGARFKLFFTPSVVISIVLSLLQAASLVLMALIY